MINQYLNNEYMIEYYIYLYFVQKVQYPIASSLLVTGGHNQFKTQLLQVCILLRVRNQFL